MNAVRTHDGGCDQDVTLRRRRLGEGRVEAKGNLSASLHLASLHQESLMPVFPISPVPDTRQHSVALRNRGTFMGTCWEGRHRPSVPFSRGTMLHWP